MAEVREIPPGAVDAGAKALGGYSDHNEFMEGAYNRLRQQASVTLDAALSFLASSPEGRAYLLGLVFSDEGLRDLCDLAAGDLGGRAWSSALVDVVDELEAVRAALELRGDGNDG